MKVVIFGAGAWGTALASAAAARHDVTLVARDAAQALAIRSERENRRYLPGVELSPRLAIGSQAGQPVALLASDADLVIVATPMAGLRQKLEELRDHSGPLAWLCKGFEASIAGADGLLGHEVCAQVSPHLMGGVLSGPSFALEVARGQPTALVAASEFAPVRDALVKAFHGGNMRIYANDDLVGVEVGGAVKNVLAIATGLCDGLALGLNARAALVTRGLAEMTRLGVALGAQSETFMGLSGLGDLVLTATGDLSRNRQVGLMLAQGRTLQEAVESLGHVAEGVYSARTVVARADHLGVEMPISRAVVALLDGRIDAMRAVGDLMGRGPVAETA
ncbi:NAD(P)H-dependent glycerol-3-phosphate dehydrogenase [Caenimonas sp. SL110]|uniref:NAD(P)H-dependent glycerol-3-phosphate dehydrogenase n=1 Tax=Caenimonas sp. SL110 TaxID=1450524 RepID=UPI0006546D44|nr:NAD(P)H-dependent glycerol-3-phosphate dehydrogenase [Caenimonas sp. SL110]